MAVSQLAGTNTGECWIDCTLNPEEAVRGVLLAGGFRGFRDLVVEAQGGIFCARECYQEGAEISMGVDKPLAILLHFRILVGEFVSRAPETALYWSASLVNFI